MPLTSTSNFTRVSVEYDISIPMFWAGTMNAGDTFAIVVDKNGGTLGNNQIDITGFVVECLEHVIVQYSYSA